MKEILTSYWEVVVQLTSSLKVLLLEVAQWLIQGEWYEVTLKLAGAFSVLLMIRAFHFAMSSYWSEGPIFSLTVTILIMATLLWLALAVAIIWVAFFTA